jgi:hypothetical protein
VRRLHLIFAIVVVTAFVSAFLAERSRPLEPAAEPLPLPASVALEPLAVRRGEHALRGVVHDHAGRPAPEVTVHARPAGGAAAGSSEPFFFAHTGADGAFALEHLPAGLYTVVLVRPGTRITTAAVDVPAAAQVTLRLEEPYGDVPAAPDPVYVTLTGRVRRPAALDPGGLEGLEVLLLPSDDDARWRGAMERRAAVDAAGRFRVEDLAVADHRVAVVPAWARGGTWPFLVALDLTAADVARGASDEAADAIELELAVGALEGRLFDVRGRPVEGALLRIVALGDGSERAWPASSSDAQGRFRLDDLPAPPEGRLYDVSVHAGAARQVAHVEVRAGEVHEVRYGPLDVRGAVEQE